MNPGSIVRCRNREWVLLPSEQSDRLLLRPLTGALDEVVALHASLTDLVGFTFADEKVKSATFPLPTPDDLADATSAELLWQAARLTLREGAAPLRCLGRISIRPRVYQFVPLLMALRLDPVRLLIADDVGVGKTIEALLIARELLERGEVKRLCVLCPPALCEQWQKELREKFNLDAVVIRSGTVGQLERRRRGHESIYRSYPVQVVSIDFVKSDRNRSLFLLDCPDMVIVDEAHGAAVASDDYQNQHQRHQLVHELAQKENRHLIMLTATPHSGVESAFRSLISLLKPEFATLETANLTEPQRIDLARHFVQRTRRDIKTDWEGEHCFPDRDSTDETYRLSKPYQSLFSRTYDFCSEIVRESESLDKRHQRVRYWGALALLRCVMSSPAAAVAALESRHEGLIGGDEDDSAFRSFVFEPSDERPDDESPTPPVEAAESTLADTERRRLRELGKAAAELAHDKADTKLTSAAGLVAGLIKDGFNPIVWCRYIATAEYVAEGLRKSLAKQYPDLRVVAISSRTGDDEERGAKLAELAEAPRRVLVATDCLSEGINLQGSFNAVLHYDLPWNPNRLEQREGRVDRYGQASKVVKAVRYFSPDSPVDGVVLDVLLNKAREIHRTLGTHVPVPEESETVTQAVLKALFLRGKGADDSSQLRFDFGGEAPEVTAMHARWQRDAEREKVNRTRFAQRTIKPAEVRQELEAADAVLGDPDAVHRFVLNAAQRLGIAISTDKRAGVFKVLLTPQATATIPSAVASALPTPKSGQWLIAFTSPTPEGAEYLGRNHKFVSALARFLMEEALTRGGKAAASRCGVIRTRAVTVPTTVILLRVRYLLNQPDRPALLSEEVRAIGFHQDRGQPPIDDADALRLLADARPDANIAMPEKRKVIAAALDTWSAIEPQVRERVLLRATDLEQSHKRLRQAVAMRVRELKVVPQLPPDLLGILVLLPVT